MSVRPDAPIVAFDFDGTLTRRDTLLPFLIEAFGPVTVARAAARHSVTLARVATGRGDRDLAKAAFLATVLTGVAEDRIAIAAHRHTSTTIAQRLRPDTVARLRWHRTQGHHVVVVSASPEVIVRPVVTALGAHEVLATKLEIDDEGRLTGRIVGGNVRGHAKSRVLRERYGDDLRLEWAYGDSSGDDQLLELAANPVRVRRVRLSAAPEPR
jgi:phosphatidylglycerophosphatase C